MVESLKMAIGGEVMRELITVENLPEQDCDYGFSMALLEQVMPKSQWEAFGHWMSGQTMMLCSGTCGSEPHGVVAYRWDVERFAQGGEIID